MIWLCLGTGQKLISRLVYDGVQTLVVSDENLDVTWSINYNLGFIYICRAIKSSATPEQHSAYIIIVKNQISTAYSQY